MKGAFFFDLLRFVAIVVFAYALTFLIPSLPSFGSATIIPQLLLYSFLLGFLVNRCLLRKQTLFASAAVELSRLRRLHHLVEFLKNKTWAKQFQQTLNEYLKLSVHSLVSNGKMDEVFRKMTHLIYRYKPTTKHEELLYQDLLESTRELALERQRFHTAFSNGLSWYSWLVIIMNAFFVSCLLLANRQVANFSSLAVFAALIGVFITFDLLIQTNRLSKSEMQKIQNGYKKNLNVEYERTI